MNRRQKIVVLIGVAVVALMLLVPPWRYPRVERPILYTHIFTADTRGASIDLTRLAVQCGLVAVVTFGLYVALGHKKES